MTPTTEVQDPGRHREEWWGIIEAERWTPELERRALAAGDVFCEPEGRVLRWPATGHESAIGKVHDALDVGPMDFESGFPQRV